MEKFIHACMCWRKKAKLEELSNNINERLCELKSNQLVNEHSERASGYIVVFATDWKAM